MPRGYRKVPREPVGGWTPEVPILRQDMMIPREVYAEMVRRGLPMDGSEGMGGPPSTGEVVDGNPSKGYIPATPYRRKRPPEVKEGP